ADQAGDPREAGRQREERGGARETPGARVCRLARDRERLGAGVLRRDDVHRTGIQPALAVQPLAGLAFLLEALVELPALHPAAGLLRGTIVARQIGRASCRERV